MSLDLYSFLSMELEVRGSPALGSCKLPFEFWQISSRAISVQRAEGGAAGRKVAVREPHLPFFVFSNQGASSPKRSSGERLDIETGSEPPGGLLLVTDSYMHLISPVQCSRPLMVKTMLPV